MCESETSLKREWFTRTYGGVWVDCTDRETIYKDTDKGAEVDIICLQGSSQFCKRMIHEISPCNKKD